MKQLLCLAALLGLVVAKPELYKETEDFQYSRQSSDEGSKSGYYGARRGNMGGNYEKAHNMDHLAQNQMGGLVRQVDGELGDAAKLRHGNIFADASSAGIYGSGNYDTYNLHGRNFQEGVREGSVADSHSALASHSNGHVAGQAYHSSGYNNHAGYQGTKSSQALHSASLQANADAASAYGRETGYNAGHSASHSSQYEYQGAAHNSDYAVHPSNRLIVTTPVRVVVRPGGRVAVPVGVQNYDASHSASTMEHNAINTEAEVLNIPDHVIYKPSSSAKGYESSSSYHKHWEQHNVKPEVIPLAIPTENPFPINSELYDEHNALHSSALTSHGAVKSNSYNGYNANVKSASSQSRYQAGHDSQYTSGLNAQRYNTHGAYVGGFPDAINALDESKPKSHQSSYSYHKSWERQGDPYVITPIGGVDSESQRLTAASANQGYQSSHQYGAHTKSSQQRYYQANGEDCDCDENGQIRVARSIDHQKLYLSQQSQTYEDLGQQQQNKWVGQESQTNWNLHRGHASEKLEDLGQQTQHQWGDLTQQSQTGWNHGMTQNSEKFEVNRQPTQDRLRSRAPEKMGDLSGQQTQNQWDDLTQQSQTGWNQGMTQNSEKFVVHQQPTQDPRLRGRAPEKTDDLLGQQTRNQWDDLTQQSQTGWDHGGQQSWNKFEELGQLTQKDWDRQRVGSSDRHGKTQNLEKFEVIRQPAQEWDPARNRAPEKIRDLGQQTQNQWDDLTQQSQSGWNQGRKQNFGNIDEFGQQVGDNHHRARSSEKYGDLGRQNQRLGADLTQQSESTRNHGTLHNSERFEVVRQETEAERNRQRTGASAKLEDLGQQTQNDSKMRKTNWKREDRPLFAKPDHDKDMVRRRQNPWYLDDIRIEQKSQSAWRSNLGQKQSDDTKQNIQRRLAILHRGNIERKNSQEKVDSIKLHIHYGSDRSAGELQQEYETFHDYDGDDVREIQKALKPFVHSSYFNKDNTDSSEIGDAGNINSVPKSTVKSKLLGQNKDVRPINAGRGDIESKNVSKITDIENPFASRYQKVLCRENRHLKTPEEIEALSLIIHNNNSDESISFEKYTSLHHYLDDRLKVLSLEQDDWAKELKNNGSSDFVIFSHRPVNSMTDEKSDNDLYTRPEFTSKQHSHIKEHQSKSVHENSEEYDSPRHISDTEETTVGNFDKRYQSVSRQNSHTIQEQKQFESVHLNSEGYDSQGHISTTEEITVVNLHTRYQSVSRQNLNTKQEQKKTQSESVHLTSEGYDSQGHISTTEGITIGNFDTRYKSVSRQNSHTTQEPQKPQSESVNSNSEGHDSQGHRTDEKRVSNWVTGHRYVSRQNLNTTQEQKKTQSESVHLNSKGDDISTTEEKRVSNFMRNRYISRQNSNNTQEQRQPQSKSVHLNSEGRDSQGHISTTDKKRVSNFDTRYSSTPPQHSHKIQEQITGSVHQNSPNTFISSTTVTQSSQRVFTNKQNNSTEPIPDSQQLTTNWEDSNNTHPTGVNMKPFDNPDIVKENLDQQIPKQNVWGDFEHLGQERFNVGEPTDNLEQQREPVMENEYVFIVQKGMSKNQNERRANNEKIVPDNMAQPGFWESVGTKRTSTPNKVKSWFYSVLL